MKEKKLIYMVFILFTWGCSRTPSISKIFYREYYVTGSIKIEDGDTIFNGPIKYYDKAGILTSIVNFKENQQNGVATYYYKNGKIRHEEMYNCGIKNGINKVYDSSGNLLSEANYFAGLRAGPQTMFKSNAPHLYRFVNLEDWPLYTCKYENDRAIEKGNILNYFTHYINVDGNKKLELFIYLLDPPHKKITYRLYEKNMKTFDSSLIQSLNSTNGFFQKVYLDIPKENCKYFFQVEAFYPKNNIRVKDVLKDYQKELQLPDNENAVVSDQ